MQSRPRIPAAPHRAAPRPLLAAALGAVLALLAACGPSEDEADKPHFPVRQLEAGNAHPSDGRFVLEEGFETLDDWWVLGTTAEPSFTLEPAEGSAGLRQEDGHVVLLPDHALVHLVSLPATARYTLAALLLGGAAPARSPCPNLILSSAGKLKNPALAHGDFSAPGAARSLAGMMLETLPRPKATWRQEAGAGFTEARSYTDVNVDPAAPQTWVVVVAAWGEPLAVDNLSLASAPILRHGYDPSTELPADHGEIAVAGLKISGQYRLSARVPPGKTLSVPITVPEGAADITVGTCADPDPSVPPGSPSSWRLVLQPGDHLVASFDESTPPKGQAPQFTDRTLPWPAGVEGPVTVQFSVTGAAAMVFGQPKVRGPELAGVPSLLFISVDTLRADHLGFMGYDRPTTPYLDALAAQSTVFTDVTATASYTLPTHASMFTGLFPPRHMACDTLDRVDAARTPTLGRLLSDAGFHTAGFTGGGFVSVDYGFADGFDRYTTIDPVAVPKFIAPDASGRFPDSRRIEQAHEASGLDDVGRWIVRQGQRKWLVFLHTFAVHEYTPPEVDERLFARTLDLPPGFDAQVCLNTSDPVKNPPSLAARERLIDLYDATIHHADRRLGQLLHVLDEKGVLANTIVVVTADHGEEFFDHGHFRHRGTLYQDLVHVPLLIRMPGGPAGLRIDEPVSQADVLPTLLELLGEPVPEGLDGRSLAEFVRGRRPSTPPTPVFAEIDRTLHGRSALRDGALKLIHSDTSAAREEPAAVEWELYDLREDPGETRNLVAERPADVAELRARLEALQLALRTGAGPHASIEMGDELREQLVGLGYVEASR